MSEYESQEEAYYFEGSAEQEIQPTPEDSTPQPTTMEPSHPDTLRERLQPCLDIWKSQGRNDEQIYGVENFLSGQGIMGIQELLSQEKERWENELWEKVDSIISIEFHGIIEPKDFISKARVLALLTNHKSS